MEIFLRFLQVLVKIIYFFVYPLLLLLLPRRRDHVVPPIRNKLITQSLVEVMKQMRQRKLTSEELLAAYIERINEVNPYINAVIEDRFEEARKEARRADELMAKCTEEQLPLLFSRYPLLGVPFTAKESCGVKGMSHVVGSLQRTGKRSAENGDTIELVRAAGGIPLLVSANPEYCFSIETNTFTSGKCMNPFDARRTPGGSSGGEGALNGAGASLFGIGSDIAGSIRIPSLFNGVFGHKPTAGLTSVKGHFPGSSDADYGQLLQVGPITRYGRDLCLIMQIIAGKNAERLGLIDPVKTKDIRIFYSLGFDGINGLMHQSVAFDIQFAIMRAVKYLEQMGLQNERAHIKGFRNSTEIALSAIVRLQDFPYLINSSNSSKVWENLREYVKSFFGKSQYTKDGLIFELLRRSNCFMPKRNLEKYKREAETLKAEIMQILGNNGVLFFPTFHVPAVHHHTSHMPLWGIDYALIFNVLGLPATHVPMGLDRRGLPIGFQVIAAPYQDKLCFQIATELETAFGGWTPPTEN